MNKTFLTLKVQLSSSLSRSEDVELLNLFIITPACLPGYTKTSEKATCFQTVQPWTSSQPPGTALSLILLSVATTYRSEITPAEEAFTVTNSKV